MQIRCEPRRLKPSRQVYCASSILMLARAVRTYDVRTSQRIRPVFPVVFQQRYTFLPDVPHCQT